MTGLMRIFVGLITVMVLISCAAAEISEDKLQHRNGLFYAVGEETPFTGKAVSFYRDSGQKRTEKEIKDGKFEGYQGSWYANGQLRSEIVYRDGLRNGTSTEWHPNGKKKTFANYKNDKLESIYINWDSTGQKSVFGLYENGEQVGSWEYISEGFEYTIGMQHKFKVGANNLVVTAFGSGLMWQKAVIKNPNHNSTQAQENAYNWALEQVDKLNKQQFGGYSNWRLPTVTEAMALVELKPFDNQMRIDPVFTAEGRGPNQIWVAGTEAYFVDHHRGELLKTENRNRINYGVRAVRTTVLVRN